MKHQLCQTSPDTSCSSQIEGRKGQSWSRQSLKQIWPGKPVNPESAVTWKATIIHNSSFANWASSALGFVREYQRPAAPFRRGSQTPSRVPRPAVPGLCQPAPAPAYLRGVSRAVQGAANFSWIQSTGWEFRAGSDTVRSSPGNSKEHPRSREEQSTVQGPHEQSPRAAPGMAWRREQTSLEHSTEREQSLRSELNWIQGPIPRHSVGGGPKWGSQGHLGPLMALLSGPLTTSGVANQGRNSSSTRGENTQGQISVLVIAICAISNWRGVSYVRTYEKDFLMWRIIFLYELILLSAKVCCKRAGCPLEKWSTEKLPWPSQSSHLRDPSLVLCYITLPLILFTHCSLFL